MLKLINFEFVFLTISPVPKNDANSNSTLLCDKFTSRIAKVCGFKLDL